LQHKLLGVRAADSAKATQFPITSSASSTVRLSLEGDSRRRLGVDGASAGIYLATARETGGRLNGGPG
jgi:hypothetical protein